MGILHSLHLYAKWFHSYTFMKITKYIYFKFTTLGVRSLANASRTRQFNPLNPPGVGWVPLPQTNMAAVVGRARSCAVVHGRSCVVVLGSAWWCAVGRAQSCAVVRAWSCVVVRGRAWLCAVGRAWSCAVVRAWSVIRGRAWSCAVCRAWLCMVVRGRSCGSRPALP